MSVDFAKTVKRARRRMPRTAYADRPTGNQQADDTQCIQNMSISMTNTQQSHMQRQASAYGACSQSLPSSATAAGPTGGHEDKVKRYRPGDRPIQHYN
eukprot:8450317-Alexandrium_andersonii.AAC.1